MNQEKLIAHVSLKSGIINEVVIKKSRFITELVPVFEQEQAATELTRVKKLHYNATHNCSATIIGAKRAFERANDDGEPQGTAGVPMLDVLKKSGVTNILAVVTRYFGGVLLGAGGLARAYGGGVAEAIKRAELVENIPADIYSFTVPYGDYGKLQKIADEFGAGIESEFSELVTANITLERTQREAFQKKITQAFMGADIFGIKGETYITRPYEQAGR